jgi:four helix bundle protein
MFRFETLDIWKVAIKYAGDIYDIADSLPQKVQFNLGSQIRASALSISNNIAEGSGSSSKQEFKNFLNYSIRSLYETVSALFVAKDRNFIDLDKFNKIYKESEVLVKRIKSFRAVL